MQTKRMPSVMTQGHTFAMVPSVDRERCVIDRSHGYKTTFDAGFLIPTMAMYVLPGDTVTCKSTYFARMNTPIKPMMDNFHLDSQYFYIPLRILWTNFVKFMGEQVNPGDSISFVVPITASPAAGYTIGTLGDYFRLPTVGVPAVTASFNHSALFARAYWLTYNQWYRDQNLINTHGVALGDGPDNAATEVNVVPAKRGKRHDYFTSCLPQLQKGGASAALVTPLGAGVTPFTVTSVGGGGASTLTRAAGAAGAITATGAGNAGQLFWTDPQLQVLVNDMRLAVAIQRLLERDSRGGTRYPEMVFAHWGVKNPDSRMQRSEYLGGGSTPVEIQPNAQTSATGLTGSTTPLGNLSAVAAVVAHGHGFSKSFTEHGIILGIISVRADLTYQQGLLREWSYSTRYDFPTPVLAHIGEQGVLNKEIFCTGAVADASVFGYQERYGEARYYPSGVTGKFRSTYATTLEIWHASEKFGALPTLGQTFIEDQTHAVLQSRIAVPAEPDFNLDCWHDMKWARVLPVYGVPGLMDHF